MAYEKRFDGKADHYMAARPAYSEDFIDFLYEEMGLDEKSIVADIGCGTGKLTAQLLKRGTFVYGVEPNPGMQDKARKALADYENFCLVDGNDAATGLADDSVDYVVVGQAFHWFDPEKFAGECSRILKSQGKVFLIWNLRDQKYPVNRDWTGIFREFADNFIGFNNGLVPDDPRIQTFFPEGYTYQEFDNTLCFSRELFLKRLLSSSYAPMAGNPRYEAFLARANEIFDRHQEDGRIRVPHVTAVYWA